MIILAIIEQIHLQDIDTKLEVFEESLINFKVLDCCSPLKSISKVDRYRKEILYIVSFVFSSIMTILESITHFSSIDSILAMSR